MNTNVNPCINTDVLSGIISFLDITEDKSILTSCQQIFNLTDNESNKILRIWENNSKYECKKDENRTNWYVNGKIHRDNDRPAIEYADGYKAWFINGRRHRDYDLPAVEHPTGTKEWYVNGRLHRDNDKPAVERSNGNKEWWVNDKLIRINYF
jgi:hypothetical protein